MLEDYFYRTTTHILSNSTTIIPSVAFDAIHRDSGGLVNILGGVNIGHCKKRSSYEHVSNSEWLPGESSLNIQIKGIVNGYKGREITCYSFDSNFNLKF